jgi:hypothetical protein
LPGHLFRAEQGPVTVNIGLKLISQDNIRNIEVIKDGKVEAVVDVGGELEQRRSTSVTFQESGWFLVRAIADHPKTFRFASTAPFYVDIGGKSRISRRSSEFFVDWLKERREYLAKQFNDPTARQEVMQYVDKALSFWEEKARTSTTE